MAVTRVQSTTGTTPFGAAPTVGNRIYVACFSFSATVAPFDNASGGTNTYTQIGTDAVDVSGNHVGWYKADIARTNAALALGNASGDGMHAIEVTGFDTGSVTDSGLIKTLQASTSSAVSLVSGTVGVTVTGGMILAAVIDQNTATWSVSAPDTQLANTTTHDRDISSYQENVASGSYTPTFTANATASNTAAMAAFSILSLPAAPTINTQPTPQTCYVGETATFSLTATASAGSLSYQWKDDGSNVGTNSNSYTTAAAVSADDGAQITCDVTDSNGTTTSNAVRWTVLPAASVFYLRA